MAGLFLGIDGGGSKTSCWLGDSSSLLGQGTSAGSNLLRVGEARARQALSSAIEQACRMGGVRASEISHTAVGVAGAGRREVEHAVRVMLADLVSGEIEVVPDMIIAQQAAFGEQPGAVVISGTGSIAFGRNAQGGTARAGGWGYVVSDQGSGHWIGLTAVAAALRAHDQGRPTRLGDDIARAWGRDDIEHCVAVANAAPPPDFARLVPLVRILAEAGDQTAAAVLEQAAGELAGLAGIVLARLFAPEQPVPVAMCGGVFRHCAEVRQAFGRQCQTRFPQARVGPEVVEPVAGALARARARSQAGE